MTFKPGLMHASQQFHLDLDKDFIGQISRLVNVKRKYNPHHMLQPLINRPMDFIHKIILLYNYNLYFCFCSKLKFYLCCKVYAFSTIQIFWSKHNRKYEYSPDRIRTNGKRNRGHCIASRPYNNL